MLITNEQMRRFAGEKAATLSHTLNDAAIRWRIDTPARIVCWMGQLSVESGLFTMVRESLNYSVEGLLEGFSRSRISEQTARTYGRLEHIVDGHKIVERPANQEAIANFLYGGEWGAKNLGNTEAGDGWRCIGRGWKQITGHSNYTRYGHAMYGDDRIYLRPDLLEQPLDAAMSAGWFWDDNQLSRYADDSNVVELSSVVNTGKAGRVAKALDKRLSETNRAREIWV